MYNTPKPITAMITAIFTITTTLFTKDDWLMPM